MLLQVLRGIRALIRLRRRVAGPRLPSWSEDFETMATVLHHYGQRAHRLPLAWQRRIISTPRGPADARVTRTPVRAGGVPAQWFHAGGVGPGQRVVLYLHGGGYSIGSIESHRDFIAALCRAGELSALAIDYRLAPEHRFPAQLDDALAAYGWLLEQGVAPGRIVVAGDSAGGGLTMSLLLALRDREMRLPAGAVCISPWVDLGLGSHSFAANERYDYLNAAVLGAFARRFALPHEVRHPLASPLYADLRGLPPLLVQVGAAEVLLDDARGLAARARAAGVEVELDVADDIIHAYPLFAPRFQRSQEAVEQAARFIRSACR